MAARAAPVQDFVGAFCRHGLFTVPGSATGLLSGQDFGAKDLFDVAGHITGAGNPRWLQTHPPAHFTAPAVQALLDAGATLIGKTLTDELAYSLNGDNRHYGTPINVNAPGRFPGGSSSGSAAAVAAGLCDFALATDSGGSIRVPASFCGLYGIRTTHGRISTAGIVPLMPSFDTIGWFAAGARGFAMIGSALLDRSQEATTEFGRLLVLQDAHAELEPGGRHAMRKAEARLADLFQERVAARLAPEGLEAWRTTFRYTSAAETWRVHGEWIETAKPNFAPAIAERFAWAKSVTAERAAVAGNARREITARILTIMGNDTFLCLPSTPGIAPELDDVADNIELFRQRTQRLTCIASLAGLPQVSIPTARLDGCPFGLSIIGPPNSDLRLLELCVRFAVLAGEPQQRALPGATKG
jgi:amidase